MTKAELIHDLKIKMEQSIGDLRRAAELAAPALVTPELTEAYRVKLEARFANEQASKAYKDLLRDTYPDFVRELGYTPEEDPLSVLRKAMLATSDYRSKVSSIRNSFENLIKKLEKTKDHDKLIALCNLVELDYGDDIYGVDVDAKGLNVPLLKKCISEQKALPTPEEDE